jgi:O-antigen ligase
MVGVGVGATVTAALLIGLPTVIASDYATTYSLGTRALIWQAYLGAWQTSPVFGLGPGNGLATVQFLSPYGAEYGAHNNYLYLAADYGLLGLLLVGGCLGVIAVSCFRMQKALRASAPFSLGATAILIALVVHSLFDDTLVLFPYRVALLALIAIAFREEAARPGSIAAV